MNVKFLDRAILQNYAFRVLDAAANSLLLSYIPQIVQALRYDQLGFIEEFILRAGSLSSLFAHQIIWNLRANLFKDWQKELVRSLC